MKKSYYIVQLISPTCVYYLGSYGEDVMGYNLFQNPNYRVVKFPSKKEALKALKKVDLNGLVIDKIHLIKFGVQSITKVK